MTFGWIRRLVTSHILYTISVTFYRCVARNIRLLDSVMILRFWTDWSLQTVKTQIRSSLIRVYTVCHCVCIFWTHYSIVKPCCSNFRMITANFSGVQIFRSFTVVMRFYSNIVVLLYDCRTILWFLAELSVHEEMCGGSSYHTHAEGMGQKDCTDDPRKIKGHPGLERLHQGAIWWSEERLHKQYEKVYG